MWAAITKPFAWLMRWLYGLTGSYGLSVILFAFAVNLIMMPFMAKSKKSTMKTARLQPKIKELQNKHGGNQQKLNEEMQKLYREEGINPMSGCIWTLIPFPILIALYSVIRQPLSRMMFIASDKVTEITNFLVDKGLYTIPAKTDAYAEIAITDIIHNNWDKFSDFFSGIENLIDHAINFKFIGINLGYRPWDQLKTALNGGAVEFLPVFIIVLIPFISAFLSWLTMKVTQLANPTQQDAQTEATTKSMSAVMPIMSIWICFIMPAAMGIYWIANSIFGMGRDLFLTKIFVKQMEKEDAEKIAAKSEWEKSLEDNRLETEKLRSEGKSEVNSNTSKKKIQASEKQKVDERKAALNREDRAARREMLGIQDEEVPASQEGNRRYARGRAYDPNRFAVQQPDGQASEETAAPAEGETKEE